MSNIFKVQNLQSGKGWQCSNIADGYDFLTQKLYCSDCYPALEQTARHMHYNHVKVRLKERYRLELDLPMYFEMLSQINNSDTHTWLYKVNAHKSVHKVTVNNKSVIVMYRKVTQSIVTALPSKTRILETDHKGFLKVN